MTEIAIASGAPRANDTSAWEAIDWQQAQRQVKRIQMRIAKAHREGKPGKVKALQWLLTHSFYAKALAVKRVSSNRGSKTPGVDQDVWLSSKRKMQATRSLKRQGYKAQPTRRIYIPKKSGKKKRPLSIPTMRDRAFQALHLLALEPVAEMMANKNAYGFRPLRGTADALDQCFKALSRQSSAEYILEADIKSCFDSLSWEWLLENTPTDKRMLTQWLKAGHIEGNQHFTTEKGIAQGGSISPTILNVALSGLEKAVKDATKQSDKVNVIIYADDFIITAKSENILTEKVLPVVRHFLKQRGLVLSTDKTKITHINKGFDFLGVNIRKYRNGKLIRKPAKNNVKELKKNLKEVIKRSGGLKTEKLIEQLNPKLRGWANYYQPYCSKKTFAKIDKDLFQLIWRWATKRHPNKGRKWIAKKYFRKQGHNQWRFFTTIKGKEGKTDYLHLVKIAHVPIKRHIKIRAEATPYDPAYRDYIQERLHRRQQGTLSRPCESTGSAWWGLEPTG